MADGDRDITSALHDFWRARRRANLREALSFLGGGSTDLLSYEEVRRKLRAVEEAPAKLEEVPLDAIVGSVGRYNDFTRGFLPRQDSDKDRWAGVRQAMTGLEGVPPIEVYRLGDAYFVKDGNHRVSVARQLGAKYLQAYVTPVRSRVSLESDVELDDLIIKAEQADFLLETRLDELRPGADVTLTAPGKYAILLEHISVHRYFMGIDLDRPVPYQEAVAHWYDEVYLPVVESIRHNGLLRGFPGRTEADLYLWLSEHRSTLEQELGWSLPAETVAHGVASEVVGERGLSPERRERALQGAAGEVTETAGAGERIGEDVLVALPDTDDALLALDQALAVARRERSRLYGLHVVEGEENAERIRALRRTFEDRCCKAGVPAQFATAHGQVQAQLLARATWSDLVVAPLPTASGGEVRLSAGYRSFLRRSPRPTLTIHGNASELCRGLVAYDGGTRANAALFIAAYIAIKWKTSLAVLTVNESLATGSPLLRAREYLEAHGVEATYLATRGRVGPTIVEAAEAHDCDIVLMGSYKFSRTLETMLGGVLEEVLGRLRGAVLVA
jgi:nucleotide-binding universal stress UspA family protein